MLDSSRFKLAPKGGARPVANVEIEVLPVRAIERDDPAPDFTRLELVADADFEHAFASTLPPQNLSPSEMLAGCVAIFESQERFELNAEARKLLMVLAEVRWLTAFANREFFKEYGAANITEFVKNGGIRTESGRVLGLRNWYQHKEIATAFESLQQRIRLEAPREQNRLLRRVLEIGPTKLLILNQIQKLKGEELFHQLVLGLDDGSVAIAAMGSTDPRNASVNEIKGWIDLLRSDEGVPERTTGWLNSFNKLHEAIVQKKIAIPEAQKGELRRWLGEMLTALEEGEI